MTADLKLRKLLKNLNVPTQDLAQLTFCGGSKELQIAEWVNTLPMTRINFVSTLLYKAVPEVTRLKTTPDSRLAMLEILRPVVQQCIGGLSQQFLNQPLILPESARKTATIAQALQKHMTNGYLAVVKELCSADNSELQNLQALAIHRAITGLGLLLLRSYQLYTPIAGQLWTELHTLFLVAEQLKLAELNVDDPLPHHQKIDTIPLAYLRPILLACARPNQMRQDEVLATYNALEQLCPLAQLLPYAPKQKENLFAIDLNSNQPPMYKSRLPMEIGGEIRELNTSGLAATLEEIPKQKASATLTRADFTPALMEHLIQAWNILAQRSFERQEVSGNIEVTVGLTNLHFYASGNLPFTLFLDQDASVNDDSKDKEIFKKRGIQLKPDAETENDPWESAINASSLLAGKPLATGHIEQTLRQQQQQNYEGKHPIHSIPILDTSPGGYCLEWQDEIPTQVKAGELLGLREEGRKRWSLGVVRWARQTRGASQLGIQIIAPQAIPLGVAMIHKTGGYSEYLRALQLPALKAINQPATILTNAVSFQEYSKVRVYDPIGNIKTSTERTLQLTQRVFATGAFNQFVFREVASSQASDNDKQGDEDFDSVWKKN